MPWHNTAANGACKCQNARGATSCTAHRAQLWHPFLRDDQPITAFMATEGENAGNQACCWACAINVTLPLIGDPPVPSHIFKCGWCGAINERKDFLHTQRLARTRTCFSRTMKCLTKLQWLVVVFVFVLTCSIILLGVGLVLPNTCTSTPALLLNHAITFVLTFQVLFNYAATVMNSAGTVAECFELPVKPGQYIPQGAFNDMRYCAVCQGPKPRSAHHCSTCGVCIMDMDHHCPFVANCVGCGNMRSFLSFTSWVVMAMTFCIMHSALLIRHNTQLLAANASHAWQAVHSGWDILLLLATCIQGIPSHVLAALYILITAGALLLAVGLLWWSTVSSVFEGHGSTSSVSLVQGQAVQAAEQCQEQHCSHGWLRRKALGFKAGVSNVSSVMGGTSVAAWLMPQWSPPDGVLLTHRSKKLS